MILLYKVPNIVKLIEAESKIVVARGYGVGGHGEVLFKEYNISDILDE